MALSQYEKLDALRNVKRIATSRQASLLEGIGQMQRLYPDLKVQVDSLFAPTLSELAALIARIVSAQAAVTVSAADKTAFANAAEADFRNNP